VQAVGLPRAMVQLLYRVEPADYRIIDGTRPIAL
jgi:hypothetical protein